MGVVQEGTPATILAVGIVAFLIGMVGVALYAIHTRRGTLKATGGFNLGRWRAGGSLEVDEQIRVELEGVGVWQSWVDEAEIGELLPAEKEDDSIGPR